MNKTQKIVNVCNKLILPLGSLSAKLPSRGPVTATSIPQSPAVHCQYAAPSCGLPTI